MVLFIYITGVWGSVVVKAITSRTVPGSIPGGVTGDFFSVVPSDTASENEYQGFLPG